MEFRVSEADVLACIKYGERITGSGYQGSIHVGEVGDRKLLVKAAAARGTTSWMCRWLLRREYRVYRQLVGVKGIPRCYGLLKGRYLVLEYIDSLTMRHATIENRDRFFAELIEIINSIHERGVVHGDLKRKDNILVTPDWHPYLIDFGVSTIRKRGFHPLNHFWHKFSFQQDLNAWVKHKYDRNYQSLSADDAKHYRPLLIEHVARVIKRTWGDIRNGKNVVSPS